MESRQISYGKYGPVVFQHHRFSTLDFADLRKRLSTSIEAAGLWVLHEVDAQAQLQRDNFIIGGAVQILAFHPRFMARLLAADPAALLAAPLKFALLALPDGTVAISWADHAASFARYGRTELDELGDELAALSHAIVGAALTDEH
jgi:uncharacterized protein (DUF302 family)